MAERKVKVEVYGFVFWIVTFFGFGAYLIWAYIPTSVLNQLGLTYYPNKYWAIAIPTYFGVTWVMGIIVYLAINLITTEPLDSFYTITDEYARETEEEDRFYKEKKGIPPIADIPVTVVNKLLYQVQQCSEPVVSFKEDKQIIEQTSSSME